jgi:hypothetical protein
MSVTLNSKNVKEDARTYILNYQDGTNNFDIKVKEDSFKNALRVATEYIINKYNEPRSVVLSRLSLISA